MKTAETVKWGIIGVGDVTEVKSGPVFYKIDHSNLVSVMRRDAQKAENYARRHGVQAWTSDASDLINDPAVNAVYIATPPDSHANYAITAMRTGKPVYVEKPMARSHAECQEMLQVTKETGMPLWVAYYRRTLPVFLKAKELIETGEIGKPLEVAIRLHQQAAEEHQSRQEMNWRVFPEVSGAGYFFDLASHQFDYLDFVFGRVTEVRGKAHNFGGLYPAEDTVTGTWRHESGVTGSGSWSFIVGENLERDELEITGEKGSIMLSCFKRPDTMTMTLNGRVTGLQLENPENISQYLVQQVVDELRGVGTCVSTGWSAARTSWVLDEMVRDYYAGKDA